MFDGRQTSSPLRYVAGRYQALFTTRRRPPAMGLVAFIVALARRWGLPFMIPALALWAGINGLCAALDR